MSEICITKDPADAKRELLRLVSPEVQSLIHIVREGTCMYSGKEYSDKARQKYDRAVECITSYPAERIDQLRAAYEKVLGKTVEQIMEEDFEKIRYTSLPHDGPDIGNKGQVTD